MFGLLDLGNRFFLMKNTYFRNVNEYTYTAVLIIILFFYLFHIYEINIKLESTKVYDDGLRTVLRYRKRERVKTLEKKRLCAHGLNRNYCTV